MCVLLYVVIFDLLSLHFHCFVFIFIITCILYTYLQLVIYVLWVYACVLLLFFFVSYQFLFHFLYFFFSSWYFVTRKKTHRTFFSTCFLNEAKTQKRGWTLLPPSISLLLFFCVVLYYISNCIHFILYFISY